MLVLTLTFLIGPHPLNLRASHTLSGWNEFCYQDQMIHGHIERLNTFPHFSLKISAFQSDNIAAPFPVLSVGKKIHYQHSSKGPLCPTVPGTPLANDLWIHTLKSTPTFTPGRMTLVQQTPAAQSLCQEFLWPWDREDLVTLLTPATSRGNGGIRWGLNQSRLVNIQK